MTYLSKFQPPLLNCILYDAQGVHEHQNIIPTVKYGRGSIMIWDYFTASSPGPLAIIKGKMLSQIQQHILQDHVMAACQLKLSRRLGIQQDNDNQQSDIRRRKTSDFYSSSVRTQIRS